MTKPGFIILDEPDSGVDPEHLKKIGAMINETLQKEPRSQNNRDSFVRNSGLIATHSTTILDYINTDRAHVMLDGEIKCSGNPVTMMDRIRTKGYEYCITCQQNNPGDEI
jgi:Fe-S cluster assembly ATP-binding protein